MINTIIKPDTIYVLNKNEGVIAVFNKNDEDTLIDPRIEETQNKEAIFTFQVPTSSEKWNSTYNPENLYLVEGKMFSTSFKDSINTILDENGQEIVTITAYERQKLLEREYVKVYNSTTGFEEVDDMGKPVEGGKIYIDEFMVIVLSGGDKELLNNGHLVPTKHEKGTSGYALDAILYGTGWTTGICDVEGKFDLETDQLSIYENIAKIQELWGGILVVDSLNKIIHHRDETKYLPYSGYEVKEEKNLQTYEYIGDNKIITALCPLGEGSLNIKSVNNDSLWLTNFSYTDTIYRSIENNDEITDPEQLKKWGERKLQELCKPRKELSVTFPLLKHVEGFELEEIHLNDIVDVTNYNLEEDKVSQLRVIVFNHYIWSDEDAEITLGDITLESTDIFKKNVQATNNIIDGTLNTSQIIDYYKNGQSLKETLRQVDQTIISTKSELTKTDEAIKASVEQIETNVDNLNNDIVSQSKTLAELLISVGEITSKVETVADLTETITNTQGRVVLDKAVEGYLLGLSIHGYNGSFVGTYLSDDTVLSDDLYLLNNNIILNVYTKNKCPTTEKYYEQGYIDENDLENLKNKIESITSKHYISIYTDRATIQETANNQTLYYLDVKPNSKYLINLNVSSLPENAIFNIASYSKEWINLIQSEEFQEFTLNSYNTNAYYENGWKYDTTKTSFEITTTENDEQLIIYKSSSVDINNITIIDITKENYLKAKEPFKIEPNSEMYFSLDNSNYRFVDIYFYNKNKELINSWNKLYPEIPVFNTTEVQIDILENAYYMNYVITKKIGNIIQTNEQNLISMAKTTYNTNTNENPSENEVGGIVKPEGEINPDEDIEESYTPIIEPSSITLAKPQLEYGLLKTDFVNYNTQRWEFELSEELRAVEEEEYINDISPDEKIGYELGSYSKNNGDKTEATNRLRILDLLDIKDNKSLEFVIKDSTFQFDNVFFYNQFKTYIGDWNTLNPEDLIENKTNKIIELIEDTRYITYTVKKTDDTDISSEDISNLSLDINEKNKVYDEFTIVDKNAMLIRRIAVDDEGNNYIMSSPEYISYGEIEIPIVSGQNILEIFYYKPTIIAEFAVQNRYTDLFATKVEVSTLIQQTDEKILLSASKQISKGELIQEFNSEIAITPEKIHIEGNKISIISNYFQLTDEGEITATKGYIAGLKLWQDRESSSGIIRSWLTKDFVEGTKTYRSGILIKDSDGYNSDFIFAGMPVGEDGSWNTVNSKIRIFHDGRVGIQSENGELYTTYSNGYYSMRFFADSLRRYLSNGNNWSSEGISYRNGVASGHGVFLYDAQYFEVINAAGGNELIFQLNRDTMKAYFGGSLVVNGINPVMYSVQTSGQQIAQMRLLVSYVEFTVPGIGAYSISGISQSDTKLKNNIKDSEVNGLEAINKIQHIQFDWKETKQSLRKGHEEIGHSANQIQEALGNNIVYSTEQPKDSEFDSLLQIDYNRLMPYITKAIQEEDIKVEKLAKKAEKLEKENQKLKEIVKTFADKLGLTEEINNILKD